MHDLLASQAIIQALYEVASTEESKDNYVHVKLHINLKNIPVKGKTGSGRKKVATCPAYLQRIGYGKGRHEGQPCVQLRVYFRRDKKDPWDRKGNAYSRHDEEPIHADEGKV